MFNEWYKPQSCLQFPVGGSQEMANALGRAVRRRGGRVYTKAHVEQITLDDNGVATGSTSPKTCIETGDHGILFRDDTAKTHSWQLCRCMKTTKGRGSERLCTCSIDLKRELRC